MRNALNVTLAVIIPAYNEADEIARVVNDVKKIALPIVVDDGSTDNTPSLAQELGANVVRHKKNEGYDQALESGLNRAVELGCIFAITMDADGQHDPSELKNFLTELEAGADLVVGERDCTQRWSESLFCVVGNLIWGLRDPLCGMKGYRLEILSSIGKINTYPSIGTELAIRLLKGGSRVSQLRIKTKQRSGDSRFGSGLIANFRIIKSLILALKCKPFTTHKLKHREAQQIKDNS